MNIYAPSYKRAKGVKTHRIIPSITYCVHEFEAQEYIDEGYKVEIMPDEIGGNIARVRNYMLKHYIKDKGLIIDDDIEALKFWSTEDGLPKSKNIEVNYILPQLTKETQCFFIREGADYNSSCLCWKNDNYWDNSITNCNKWP